MPPLSDMKSLSVSSFMLVAVFKITALDSGCRLLQVAVTWRFCLKSFQWLLCLPIYPYPPVLAVLPERPPGSDLVFNLIMSVSPVLSVLPEPPHISELNDSLDTSLFTYPLFTFKLLSELLLFKLSVWLLMNFHIQPLLLSGHCKLSHLTYCLYFFVFSIYTKLPQAESATF